MQRERHMWLAMMGASIAHAAALLVVARVAWSSPSTPVAALPVADPDGMTLELLVPMGTLDVDEPLLPPPALRDAPRERRDANAPRGETTHRLQAAAERPEQPGSPVAPSSGETWSLSMLDRTHPAAGPVDLIPGPRAPASVADTTKNGVRRAVDEESAPADADALASVRAGVHQRDRALGMSPGAPLLPLIRDTVRRSNAPRTGRVRLELRTDEHGIVTTVRVLDASSSRAWSEVAQTLEKDARARVLSVPEGARGLAVTIDVSSYVTTASGISRGETAVSVASPLATGAVKASPAPQPLRFNLIVGPNQIDATMHLGVGDALHDATRPDRRVVAAKIVDERPL